MIGIDPALVDFSRMPELNAEKVMAAVNDGAGKLIALGYSVQHCLVDAGATAEEVVKRTLSQNTFDCILIGAGIRTLPEHFALFEKVINIVHENAPAAKLCFNTTPADTAEAVLRWTS